MTDCLFHNVTTEWIKLVWQDPATGEQRVLTSTPGHVMLTPEGKSHVELHGSEAQDLPQGFVFLQLIDMIVPGNSVRDGGSHQVRDGDLTLTKGQEFGTEIGTARLVTAEGDVVTAEARYLRYSAATAHLFEEAEMLVTRTEGGLAVKPEWKKGWKTYNFEVEEYHTYIAGGIRVHNISADWAHDYRGLEISPDESHASLANWTGATSSIPIDAVVAANVARMLSHDGSGRGITASSPEIPVMPRFSFFPRHLIYRHFP